MYNSLANFLKGGAIINTVYIIFTDKNKQKKTISAFAKNFVKYKAAKILNIHSNDVIFEITDNGKPFIKNHLEFHFNISHTSGAVAVALGSSPIGIDIERIRKADMRVAERFFSTSEKMAIKSDTDFFAIWTKKEAFIKKNDLTLSHLKKANSENIYTFEKDGYIISVCSDDSENRIIFLDEKESDNS